MLPVVLIGKIGIVALLTGASLQPATTTPASSTPPAAVATREHKVYGTVQSLVGNQLVIRTRTGQLLHVDGRAAFSSVRLSQNRPVIVYWTTTTAGVVHATRVWRTFPDAAHWPADQ